MTDYSTMADDEIDALVATRVMEWQAWPQDRYGPWRPSLYWSDAGRVAERIQKEWIVRLIGGPDGRWGCTMVRRDRRAVIARAPTAPRAICEAALRAMDAQQRSES